MQIITILRRKGEGVATVKPDDDIRAVLAALNEHRCGALVVSGDGVQIDGIVSERDIVRALHERGPALLDEKVRAVMSAKVRTCAPLASIEDVMRDMTEHRIRHVPVVDDGRLAGIVSIGDVVKWRIDLLEDEREALRAYVTQG